MKNFILVGVILKSKGAISVNLSAVRGLCRTKGSRICFNLGISPWRKFEQLGILGKGMILKYYLFSNYYLGERLMWELKNNIRRYTESYSNRGLKLLSGLPVNGQRSKTNGKTSKSFKLWRTKEFGTKISDEIINGKIKNKRITKRRLRKKKKKKKKKNKYI